MPKSQMRPVMRRGELAHERQKTNLAEPLVSKSWLRCTDKNFADFAKNGVFQHNGRKADVRCGLHQGPLSGTLPPLPSAISTTLFFRYRYSVRVSINADFQPALDGFAKYRFATHKEPTFLDLPFKGTSA